MMSLRSGLSLLLSLLVTATVATAKPRGERLGIVSDNVYVDRIGDLDGTWSSPAKTTQVDTIWIADWTFDGLGGTCDDSGWEAVDHRLLSQGELFWSVDSANDGEGGVTGNAAVCSRNDPCCVAGAGYSNEWYQAVRVEYSGPGMLSFDYLLDSEAGYDFLYVEMDSACASFEQTDQNNDGVIDDPTWGASTFGLKLNRSASYASRFRRVQFQDSGLNLVGRVDSLTLSGFGTEETHCVYISFFSDVGWSPCDGRTSTILGAATVLDNIEIVTSHTSILETFEGSVSPSIEFVDLWDAVGFGNWGRLHKHITDNDLCTENTTCAWLFSDDDTPTVANDPSMAFGPSAFVVRNWLDVSIVSPWVELTHIPDAEGLVSSFQVYGGNDFSSSRIVKFQTVRGRNEQGCVSRWRSPFISPAGSFSWGSDTDDFSQLVGSDWDEVQIAIHVADYQLIWGWPPPTDFTPGPGPYLDRVRIGRVVRTGPLFVPRIPGTGGVPWAFGYAQDAFPTEPHPFVTPGTGEHFRPTTDRFGTAAFSMSHDIGGTGSPNLIPGDSIVVGVVDARNTGDIASVEWYGAIVSGPHQGKAPPPWSVGGNGFFQVSPENAMQPDGALIEDTWFVDLDDDYFRGGDELRYFWLATDAFGGTSSDPDGLSGVPNSVAEAESFTGGLYEVSFLPTMNWASSYLDRIAADPHGKLEPSAEELAASAQSSCILYVNGVNISRRRSGRINRTSFMYTLDRLGYDGLYDVYDHQGSGTVANELGGRATIEQAVGYSLIIHDGNPGLAPALVANPKVDQATWYRNWLADGVLHESGTASLWLIGRTLAERLGPDPLLTSDMGVELVLQDILPTLGANPDVAGQASFAFASGIAADFTNGQFTVQAACPNFPAYNGIVATGEAIVTHRWANDAGTGDGAIVMKTNSSQSWNTIMQVPTWREIRTFNSTPGSPEPEEQLMTKILNGVLPPECIQGEDPTDVDDDPEELDALPKVTALHENRPNPFNPTTTIHFDLAQGSHGKLRIYDVSGRLVRTLVNGRLERDRHHIVWDGLDDSGVPVSSGIYFYRLDAADFIDTRKMVVLR